MSDIYCSRAWFDDDNETWQIEHLWFNTDKKRGSWTTCDCDGNHEPFDGRGVIRYVKDSEKSWKDYAAWCAKTGEDPLHNYFVKREFKTEQAWTIKLRHWIGSRRYGMVVVSGRKRGCKAIPAQEFPAHVRKYINQRKVPGHYVSRDVRKPSDVDASLKCKQIANLFIIHCQIPQTRKRSEVAIARDIRRIAKSK